MLPFEPVGGRACCCLDFVPHFIILLSCYRLQQLDVYMEDFLTEFDSMLQSDSEEDFKTVVSILPYQCWDGGTVIYIVYNSGEYIATPVLGRGDSHIHVHVYRSS